MSFSKRFVVISFFLVCKTFLELSMKQKSKLFINLCTPKFYLMKKKLIFNTQIRPTYSRKLLSHYLLIASSFHLLVRKRFPYKNLEELIQTFDFVHNLRLSFMLQT